MDKEERSRFQGSSALKTSASFSWLYWCYRCGVVYLCESFFEVLPSGICSAIAYHLRGRRSFPEHLRSKAHVDRILSDRALFEQMQVRDAWLDGRLPAVWAYMYGHKHGTIRPGWENAMKEFDLGVTQLVPHHYSFVSHIFIYESKTTMI